MNDLPIFDFDDRTESIVVFCGGRKDRPMDLVFDDYDAAIIRLVQNQFVGGSKRDVINVAPKCGHQISSPPYFAGPPGNVVQDFVDDVVGDDVEKVPAIDESIQRTSNQIEIGR